MIREEMVEGLGGLVGHEQLLSLQQQQHRGAKFKRFHMIYSLNVSVNMRKLTHVPKLFYWCMISQGIR